MNSVTLFEVRDITFAPVINIHLKQNFMFNQPKNGETFRITGDWSVQSKQLKEKFSQLTDADLKFETGKENELLNRVESRLNKKREEVIGIINKIQTESVSSGI